MKIGLVQAAAVEELKENIKTIKKYAEEAKKLQCEVLCFPECFLTGYEPKEAERLAINREHLCIEEVSSMAVRYEIDILAGYMEKCREGYYIAHGIFKADGSVAHYRKTHLGEAEERYFQKGDKLEVFELSCKVKAGFQICVETHFPEITQALSLRGAQVIFAPHAIPKQAGSRKEIWMKYIPARSYDNRVFVVCCNLWDGAQFPGGCMAADPKGNVIAEFFENREGLLMAEIPAEETLNYHQKEAGKRFRYYPSKRRKELYE